ncbi:MAG: hypothetical protein K9G70_13910 [Prolixibacteraceae bacterium]|nr:hypothetical protein [Prolixibacteraceae bacterium]
MKNGLHSDLLSILEEDKRFLVLYSTAHIGDIYSSYSEDENQQSIIDQDLKFLTKITDDYCIYNGKDNQLIFDNRSPQNLFQDRVESDKLINFISGDFFSNLASNLELDESQKILFNQLNNLPLGLDFSNESEEAKKSLKSIFPDLKNNPNLGDFFQSMLKMIDNLNNGTGYEDLRKTFQEGLKINRDKIYNSENPIDYVEKQLEQINEGGLDDLISKTNELRNNKPNWFDTITNTFINLDMAGYQEDKVKIKKRGKQTFKNTTEDSFHSAFASFCDIYILNDNKGYKKTLEVYNHLKINTRIFKPDQFVEYYNQCLKFDGGQFYLDLIALHLKQVEPFIFDKEDKNSVQQYYFSDFYFFNYFNRIITFSSKDNDNEFTLMLTKDKPTNGKFILQKEVEALVENMMDYFGEDKDSMGIMSKVEFSQFDNWPGRSWILKYYTLRLVNMNGYLQLYIDFNNEN